MIRRLRASAKWFVFAVRAGDERRAHYSRLIGRLRRGEIRRRAASVVQLPPTGVEIPSTVGFAVCPPGTLDGIDEVIAEVQRARRGLTLPRDGVEKPYLLDHAIADPSPALMEFALSEQVLGPAARYLGMVPLLTGITLLASPHVPGPASGSQLFHSDWEDVRQVKVFVNCSAVEPANGPLTAVAADASRRVKRAVRYRYGGPSFRLPDERVYPLVAADEVAAFVGPPGTAVFIDTSSCLHLGSRVDAGAGERLVVQFQYLTPMAFDLVLERGRRHPFAGAAQAASPVARLVAGEPG